jgi:hypothetical protein
MCIQQGLAAPSCVHLQAMLCSRGLGRPNQSNNANSSKRHIVMSHVTSSEHEPDISSGRQEDHSHNLFFERGAALATSLLICSSLPALYARMYCFKCFRTLLHNTAVVAVHDSVPRPSPLVVLDGSSFLRALGPWNASRSMPTPMLAKRQFSPSVMKAPITKMLWSHTSPKSPVRSHFFLGWPLHHGTR